MASPSQPFMPMQMAPPTNHMQQPAMPMHMPMNPMQQPMPIQPPPQPQPQAAASPSVPAAAPSASSLFAVLIPGRTLRTDFSLMSPTKLQMQLPAPATIAELTVCMLQPSIPPDHAVAVYYALPPFTDYQYLGFISLQVPSKTFRAVWRDKIAPDVAAIHIGLSVEPASTISQLVPVDAKEEARTLDSAKGIAKNLYEFMASYSQNTGQYKHLGDVLVIPTNCVDKWFEKFQYKHKLEPYFWLKKDAHQQ